MPTLSQRGDAAADRRRSGRSRRRCRDDQARGRVSLDGRARRVAVLRRRGRAVHQRPRAHPRRLLRPAEPTRSPQRLLADQLADGGWNCDAPASVRSSFHSTICVLEGLLAYERAVGGASRSPTARRRGEAYLLERGMFRRRRPARSRPGVPRRSRSRRATTTTCCAALDHLRDAGAAPDARIADAIALVERRGSPTGAGCSIAATPTGAVGVGPTRPSASRAAGTRCARCASCAGTGAAESVHRAVARRELAQHVTDVAERALQADHRIAGLDQLLARIGVHDQRGGDRVGARARIVERAHEVAQLRAALLDHLGEPIAQLDQPAMVVVRVVPDRRRIGERARLDQAVRALGGQLARDLDAARRRGAAARTGHRAAPRSR